MPTLHKNNGLKYNIVWTFIFSSQEICKIKKEILNWAVKLIMFISIYN